MRYFFDTEFIEGFTKPLFGKPQHFIDLISIGIVAEDGREYYAISNEFDPRRADDWVKKNVIEKLEYIQTFKEDPDYWQVYEGMQAVRKSGKPNKQIAKEIIRFVNPQLTGHDYIYPLLEDENFCQHHNLKVFPVKDNEERPYNIWRTQPEFWAYYAAYDWTLLCSLFGKMIKLPTGFPMYCYDLKQFMDSAGLTKEWKRTNVPDPQGEHNALVDARWNKKLFDAVTTEKILQLQQLTADAGQAGKPGNSFIIVPHKEDCHAVQLVKENEAPTEYNVVHITPVYCNGEGVELTRGALIEQGGTLFYELNCGDKDCPAKKRVKAAAIGNM